MIASLTASRLPFDEALMKRPQVCHGFEVAIAVEQEQVVVDGELRDAAVDRAADGESLPAQVEVDARGRGPGFPGRIQVFLCGQVFAQQGPLLLVAAALQRLNLGEGGQG